MFGRRRFCPPAAYEASGFGSTRAPRQKLDTKGGAMGLVLSNGLSRKLDDRGAQGQKSPCLSRK
jgi:hypothetical protein